MTPREELAALRRMAELEAKAAAAKPQEPQPEDPGMLGAAAIGVGRGFDKLAAGARNLSRTYLGDRVTGAIDSFGRKLGMADGSQLEAQQTAADAAYAPLADKYPIATGAGEIVPAALMSAVSGGPAAMIAASALPGLIEYGTPEERLTRGAFGAAGGALGVGAGKLAGRMLQPTRAGGAAASSDVLDAASRIGYTPTAGQQTGSRALQALEQQAAKNPISSGSAQAFNTRNTQAINRAAARAIGEDAPALTEEVMSSAAQRLGSKFESMFTPDVKIPVKESFGAYAQLLQKSAAKAGEFAQADVQALAQKAAAVAERGAIAGDEYQAMRSALSAIKRSAATGNNGPLKSAASGVIKALDDAANKVVPADKAADYATTRGQYAAMKMLEKRGAIKGGNVDPAIVRNALQSSDRAAFARGTMPGELADIARIGNAFRPLPDSGTAGNLTSQLLLTAGAGFVDPTAVATTLAAPYLGGKALFSDAGRKYLTRGLLNVTPEMERALIRAGALPGGLLGLQSAQ